MNVYLQALGCRLNEAELERWSRRFREAGHRVLARPEGAQVMVLNSCAVTGEAARKSRKSTRSLHRGNPTAKIVLTGCYAALEPEQAAALAGVDLVVPNQDKDQLVDRVLDLDFSSMPARAVEPDAGPHVFAEGRTRAFVKVQDGCRNRCSFCIVTVARGDERSRTVQQVVDEINALHGEGYQECVLSGVHLGGYGSDLGVGLDALLRAVLEQTAIPRIRLGSLEPWDLPDGFFSLFDDPRLCPHLHLPLQSGSDRILKRMARRCSTDEFRGLAAEAEARGITLTTDLIVGFPGETDDDFAASAQLCLDVAFAHIHCFSFSPREGTAAARMSGQVPKADKKRRSRVIRNLSARTRQQRLAQSIGQVRPVLWEGRGAPTEGGRRFFGYTDHFLRVSTVSSRQLHNVIEPVQLVGVEDDHLTARQAAKSRSDG